MRPIVGRDVLRRGGNAIDAAIATAFALAVTLPEAGNLGGGGFIVAYLADRPRSGDGRFPRDGTAARPSPTMYLDADGKLRPRHRAGAWAAGVPGTVRGLGLAHCPLWQDALGRAGSPGRAAGARGLSDLGRPGRLAQSPTDRPRTRSGAIAADARDDFGRLGDFPESAAAFGKPDQTPWKAGDRLVQRDLADTLDRIADSGPDEFYTGRTAQTDRRVTWRSTTALSRSTTWNPIKPSFARQSTRRSAASKSSASARLHRAGSSSARCSTSWSDST